MQTVLIVILAAVCAALAFFLYTTQKGLRSCIRQLKNRGTTGDLSPLRLDVPNAAAEELVTLINGILQSKAEDAAAYRDGEKALRAQIANVSHDLRTPLTSILGYLQLLEGDTLTPEERAEYLAVIESRAKALQSLITGFYDLSRLEGEGYPIVREQVALAPLLTDLLAAFYGDLEAAGFAVAVDMAENLPPVWGDSAALLRVFTNLIRNALDHGTGTFSVKLYREENEVVTVFQNGAPHLAPEDADHVFDRFFTSDKMRTGRNTGLGLAIVKTLTERMGGRVTATVANGNFTITLRWR
ncbi:MAG: HAMP domain-containing sensor histidine kinase [Oscillospiraceae bacterium]